MSKPLKTRVTTALKLSGFHARLDAVRMLEAVLAPLDASGEADQWIDRVVGAVQARNLESNVITKDIMKDVIQECSHAESGEDASAHMFHVVSAFEVPRFTYCSERNKYLPDEVLGKQKPKIYADADSKAQLFRARYQMLAQRTARHNLFSPAISVGGSSVAKKYKLKTVEYLLSTSSRQNDLIVLGMVTQVQHGKYSLEDPTAAVTLDLSEAKFHTGLFTENCFVLVEGWYEDALFHVIAMGFPPAETAAASRAHFGNLNFFGGPLDTCAASNKKLAQIEKDNADAMFVFLSDVWLDRAPVIERLAKLFAGYSSMPPTAFVLMGNFLSAPYGSQQAKVLKDHLQQLADMLAEYPNLIAKSRFIFVPGPTDPGYTNIFPRPALPDYLTEGLRKRLPQVEFATNPCRVQFCTQELVLFREDIVTKMCRNCIYFPESGEISAHFAKTLVSQGHLTPMALHTCPVYWDHDRAMFLYPLPDLVIIGDKFDPFVSEQLGCKIVNTGSFAKNDFAFKTYIPNSREIEESQVPGD